MAGNRDRGKMKGAMARGWGAVASNRDRDSDQKQRQWPETGIGARNRNSGQKQGQEPETGILKENTLAVK